MLLGEYLTPGRILPDVTASDREGILAALAATLADRDDVSPEVALRILQERERLGSTALGEGVAIPHGKVPGLRQPLLAVARSRTGVAYGAADGLPVRSFFLVLVPEGGASQHLRILAHLSRLLQEASFRSAFLAAADQEALWRLLRNI